MRCNFTRRSGSPLRLLVESPPESATVLDTASPIRWGRANALAHSGRPHPGCPRNWPIAFLNPHRFRPPHLKAGRNLQGCISATSVRKNSYTTPRDTTCNFVTCATLVHLYRVAWLLD